MKVGEVYEINPYFQISVNGLPTGYPKFCRFIGYSVEGKLVFQDGISFFATATEDAKINKVTTKKRKNDV